MTRFHYVRPGTVEAAVAALQESGSRATLLAGGTDLLVRLRTGRIRPTLVVDLKRIESLESGISVVGEAPDSAPGARNVLRIGARCTMTDLLANERVRDTFPALVDAARVVGSVQIRNRATVAGNMCNASPAADTAPPLLAYGAAVNTRGGAGERRVPLHQFFSGPGRTVLARDEIVTSIDLPLPSGPVGSAFMRLTRRRGVDLATLTVCCVISGDGALRVAVGAVAPTPLLVTGADLPPDQPPPRRRRSAEALRAQAEGGGHELELERVVARIAAHARPISDVRAASDYRSAMLPVFIKRAITLAVKRLDGNERWNPPGSLSPSR